MEACLLVALGTPDEPTPKAIRNFLRPFLADKRIVDLPQYLWKPILHTMVLPRRPHKIAPAYQGIWLDKGGATGHSPLTVHSLAQCEAMQELLPNIKVEYAVTYGNPGISVQLDQLMQMGVHKITVIPLYPHYAPSTVAAITDQIAIWLQKQTRIPNLQIITEYATQPTLVAWYAEQIRNMVTQYNPDRLIFSYHGVPQRPAHDPEYYKKQTVQTTKAIMQYAKVATPYTITYQSKFGPGQWLQPATIDTMELVPAQGDKNIILCTPGFLSDCLETIDELDVLNKEAFIKAGGETFNRIKPPNSDSIMGKVLAEIYNA